MPFRKGQSGNPKGRAKGTKLKSTLDKEQMRAELRRRVAEAFGPLVDAAIANAQGIKALVHRDPKTGKFTPVKLENLESMQEQGKAIEVWEEKPNVAAFTDLMNRAMDKPKETVEAEHTGSLTISWKE